MNIKLRDEHTAPENEILTLMQMDKKLLTMINKRSTVYFTSFDTIEPCKLITEAKNSARTQPLITLAWTRLGSPKINRNSP